MYKAIAFALLTLSACTFQKPSLGAEANPIKLFFTPFVDAKVLDENSQDLKSYLDEKMHLFAHTEKASIINSQVIEFAKTQALHKRWRAFRDHMPPQCPPMLVFHCFTVALSCQLDIYLTTPPHFSYCVVGTFP